MLTASVCCAEYGIGIILALLASFASPWYASGCFAQLQGPACYTHSLAPQPHSCSYITSPVCRYLAGNALDRLGMAVSNSAHVAIDIVRAYIEEIELLGALRAVLQHSRQCPAIQNSAASSFAT